MSHFYASIPRSARKTTPTARGHKSTGITTRAASYGGAIEVVLSYDEETDTDVFTIMQTQHQGSGITEIIASGTIGRPAGSTLSQVKGLKAEVERLRDIIKRDSQEKYGVLGEVSALTAAPDSTTKIHSYSTCTTGGYDYYTLPRDTSSSDSEILKTAEEIGGDKLTEHTRNLLDEINKKGIDLGDWDG